MSAPSSAIFIGSVVHSRLRPRRHFLRYSAYWLFLDIDDDGRATRFFSRNRFNLFSVCDADYGDGAPLRQQVETHLARAGIVTACRRIMLLTMPRLFGYVFNPLSIFYCYDNDERLHAIVYEVHNTFGERHVYALPVDNPDEPKIRQSCAKSFHVSPFMAMDMTYSFRLGAPGEQISVAIVAGDSDGAIIKTALHGERRAFSDAGLLRIALRVPFLTAKVVVGIHWEALRLWLKGLRVHPHPENTRPSRHPEQVANRLGTTSPS